MLTLHQQLFMSNFVSVSSAFVSRSLSQSFVPPTYQQSNSDSVNTNTTTTNQNYSTTSAAVMLMVFKLKEPPIAADGTVFAQNVISSRLCPLTGQLFTKVNSINRPCSFFWGGGSNCQRHHIPPRSSFSPTVSSRPVIGRLAAGSRFSGDFIETNDISH